MKSIKDIFKDVINKEIPEVEPIDSFVFKNKKYNINFNNKTKKFIFIDNNTGKELADYKAQNLHQAKIWFKEYLRN